MSERNNLLINHKFSIRMKKDLGIYFKRVCYFKLAHEIDVNSLLPSIVLL